jgi:CoA:oxalate CoA-transferase
MVDALIALMPTAVAQWMFGATPPQRSGNRHPLSTPFGAFRAHDGYVVICVLNGAQFVRASPSAWADRNSRSMLTLRPMR